MFLAQKLSRTVDELRESLSNAEYVRWSVFYGRKAQRQQMAMQRAK